MITKHTISAASRFTDIIHWTLTFPQLNRYSFDTQWHQFFLKLSSVPYEPSLGPLHPLLGLLCDPASRHSYRRPSPSAVSFPASLRNSPACVWEQLV